MAEALQTGLVRATEVAGTADVRRAANGLHFASFGETGVPAPDLDRMIEAVPPAITAALKDNTYFFVPLALRESEPAASPYLLSSRSEAEGSASSAGKAPEPALVAHTYTAELDARAICHRNVQLPRGGQGVFISTRLMGDRFALCFEFFINIAHAFADATGVPASFGALVWEQATGGTRGPIAAVRGETSMDAWESRNLALGLPADGNQPTPSPSRRNARATPPPTGMASRAFTITAAAETPGDQDLSSRPEAAGRSGETPVWLGAPHLDSEMWDSTTAKPQSPVDEKEKQNFQHAAFADALAMYLLSLAVDFDYTELREREYPLLAPAPLAARLKLIAELFPPNPTYEFAVRYRRR